MVQGFKFKVQSFLLLLLVCAGVSSHAGTVTQQIVTITNAPAVSATLTIAGGVHTWTNDVTASPSTLILTNADIGYALTNLFNHLATFRPTGQSTVTKTNGTTVILLSLPDASFAVTASAGWCTITTTSYSTDPGTVLRVPAAVSSAANRTNLWTLALQAIDAYSQASYTVGSTAMLNFLGLTGSQTVTGTKTFTGANLYQSATQMYQGGNISNVTAKALIIPYVAGTTNQLKIGNAVIAPDASGNAGIFALAGAGPYEANADADILNLYSAKLNFPVSNAVVTNTWFSTNNFYYLVVRGAHITNLVADAGQLSSMAIDAPTVTGAATFTEFSTKRENNTSLANGNNSGISFGKRYVKIKAGPTGAFTICGIAGGTDGRELILENATGQNMTIGYEDGNEPTPGNRIDTLSGASLVTSGNGIVGLKYDTDSSRWKVMFWESSALPSFVAAPAFVTLTDGATITWTADSLKVVQNAKVTLGGNRTLAFSGTAAGMTGVLIVKQDATGSRTLTLPAGSKVTGGGAGAITLTTTANAVDILTWVYDGTNYFWTYGLNFN